MKNVKNIPCLAIAIVAFIVLTFNGCKQDHLVLTTTSTVNMYSYMGQNEDCSLFRKVVERAGFASFLDTYGAYTLFLPTNAGVNAYLKANNKANVDEIDVQTAKKLVSIAVIADTLGSQYFTDGKMRTPTTSGQYLITSAKNINGVTSILINKQAALLKANIRVGNGIIHIVDNMLVPATLTLAQTIEQNPKYSIFTAALKATGFYDTLNVDPTVNSNLNRKYVTLIAESDSSLKAAGYNDFNAFRARYSKTGDPKQHSDSLWLYIAYHIWPELSFVSDIANSTAHNTLAPLEVTTSQVVNNQVLLNNDTFNGVLEPGQMIGRPQSDIAALNGVMHTALTSYNIKVRLPSPVYFDVAAQPELIRSTGVYRTRGAGGTTGFGFSQFAFADVAIISGNATSTNVNFGMRYWNAPAVPAANRAYTFGNDWVTLGLRFRTGNGDNVRSATFTTPLIVRGRYKIWACYLSNFGGNDQVVRSYFDGVSLPNTFTHNSGIDESKSEQQLLLEGTKSYSESPPTGSTSQGFNGFTAKLLGTVDILTTGRHKITFEATAVSNSNSQFALDAVEFRPVDMDQLRPKLGRNGTLIP